MSDGEDEAVRIARATIAEMVEVDAFNALHPDEPSEAAEPHEPCASCTMARYIVEQHDAREAARASMPEAVASAADYIHLEWHRQYDHKRHAATARALVAAHEREAELRAERDAARAKRYGQREDWYRRGFESGEAVGRAENAELRAALGESCRLLGSSGRHAYPLDAWRKLAEGGK